MSERSADRITIEQELSTSDKIKIKLIDNFLLWGAIFASVVFLIPVVTFISDSSQIDFYADIINITALFILYAFRRKVSLQLKAAFILLTVYLFFITDLYQHGLYSVVKVAIVIIPFLGILVFSLKQTIWMYVFTISSYTVIAVLYLHHIIEPITLDVQVNNPVKWINTGLLLTLVSLIVAMFVYYYNRSLHTIIDQKNNSLKIVREQDKTLKQNIHEKNILLQEIHHRVKNNLAVVSGLMELQSISASDDFIKNTLMISKNRIISIAKVHEMLYESKDFSRLPFDKYIRELSDIILSSMNSKNKSVVVNTDIRIKNLSINHGVPLGIIFNELITNSVKYGFAENEENVISITVSPKESDIEVVYEDNGVGIPDFNEASTKSLGFTLIKALMEQIQGEYIYETDGQFRLTFTFPSILESGPYQLSNDPMRSE